MENITKFKTKLASSGNSKYILVPIKVIKYEGINDDDIILVTLQKVGARNDGTENILR